MVVPWSCCLLPAPQGVAVLSRLLVVQTLSPSRSSLWGIKNPEVLAGLLEKLNRVVVAKGAPIIANGRDEVLSTIEVYRHGAHGAYRAVWVVNRRALVQVQISRRKQPALLKLCAVPLAQCITCHQANAKQALREGCEWGLHWGVPFVSVMAANRRASRTTARSVLIATTASCLVALGMAPRP